MAQKLALKALYRIHHNVPLPLSYKSNAPIAQLGLFFFVNENFINLLMDFFVLLFHRSRISSNQEKISS